MSFMSICRFTMWYSAELLFDRNLRRADKVLFSISPRSGSMPLIKWVALLDVQGGRCCSCFSTVVWYFSILSISTSAVMVNSRPWIILGRMYSFQILIAVLGLRPSIWHRPAPRSENSVLLPTLILSSAIVSSNLLLILLIPRCSCSGTISIKSSCSFQMLFMGRVVLLFGRYLNILDFVCMAKVESLF